MLKTVMLLNIFVEIHDNFFFKLHSFKIEICCMDAKVFTLTIDQFNASLLNINNSFQPQIFE